MHRLLVPGLDKKSLPVLSLRLGDIAEGFLHKPEEESASRILSFRRQEASQHVPRFDEPALISQLARILDVISGGAASWTKGGAE